MSGMGLSLSELCCLFCCPPCPSRIAAKLAFLPPDPTYSIDNSSNPTKLSLHEKAEWQYSEREQDNLEVSLARTSKGNLIACLYVKCSPNARFTILHSHGNAVDLGQMSSFYMGLGSRINCNVFSYDYSGYGASGGKTLRKKSLCGYRVRLEHAENQIQLDLASRVEVGAVILHSALMSGMRVAFPQTKRTWCFDAFPSIDKVPKVASPVLVIHGTEDEVIDFSHGIAIYEKCPRAVEPLCGLR
ncbi:ABHD17 [Lepeophtheirus salmonis]|uniref:ABHD17 n=1 Tax=Lepeophtheirus salmonis TaxID=72036 RepID=A0A7R8CNF7_LEPSM|nr:ABHD17 [Lepeophtheirus salmonis]CAF2841601.1 ABHD17 [Lepeophtheirus salmonis]